MGKGKSKYVSHECGRMPETAKNGCTDVYKINTWYAEHDGNVIPDINNCPWCGADLETERIVEEQRKYNIYKKIQIKGEIKKLNLEINEKKSNPWGQVYIMEMEAKKEHLKQKLELYK